MINKNKTKNRKKRQTPEEAIGMGPEIRKKWKEDNRIQAIGAAAAITVVVVGSGLAEADYVRGKERAQAEAPTNKAKESRSERPPSQLELNKQEVISEFQEQLSAGMQPLAQTISLKPGVNIRNYPFEFGEAGGTPLRHEVQNTESATVYYPFEMKYGSQDLLVVYDPRNEDDVFSPDNYGFISKSVTEDPRNAEITEVGLPGGTVVAKDGVLKLEFDSGSVEVGRLSIER